MTDHQAKRGGKATSQTNTGEPRALAEEVKRLARDALRFGYPLKRNEALMKLDAAIDRLAEFARALAVRQDDKGQR